MNSLSSYEYPRRPNCTKCGAATSSTAKFCGECGAIQTSESFAKQQCAPIAPATEHIRYVTSIWRRKVLIGCSSVLLAALALALWFRSHSSKVEDTKELSTRINPQSSLPQSKILTKDSSFKQFLLAPTDEDKLVGLWPLLTAHRGDWFEIGHISLSGTNMLEVHSVEASPVILVEATTFPIDLRQLDDIYSKFTEIARAQIDQDAQAWVSEQSCRAKLKIVCGNLGGSQVECSNPEKLSEIERSLPGVLAGTDCDDAASLQVGEKRAAAKLRADRLVLVGQGDLISHRIDKILLVDFDTETVLHEFPLTVIPNDLTWKFPDEGQRNRVLSSPYITHPNLPDRSDFGIVSVRSDGSIQKLTFHNPEQSNQGIAISLGRKLEAFSFERNECEYGLLHPNEDCTVTIRFKPTTLGLHSATLTDSYCSGHSGFEQNITLQGFGSWPWEPHKSDKLVNAGEMLIVQGPTRKGSYCDEIGQD